MCRVLTSSRGSSRSVDVTPVVDAVDVHDSFDIIDPVDDPVLPDSSAVPTGKVSLERMSYPVRIRDKAAEAELDDGADDLRGRRGQAL